MHWDWDWHYDHHWHRPWDTYFYHYKCPLRKRFWSSLIDFEFPDFHHYDCCYTANDWCHRSCLTGRVYIETGEEPDTCGKGTYKIIVDVHHFKADELKLKVKNLDTLILEGKHKDDRAAKMPALCITKSFVRKYKLPRNYDATLAKATLSKDGIISIIVPAPPPLDDVEREVEILPLETYFGAAVAEEANTNALEDKTDNKMETNPDDGAEK